MRNMSDASIEELMTDTDFISRESMEGFIDPKISAFVDRQMVTLKKELESTVEKEISSLKENLLKMISMPPPTPVININQEDLPWVKKNSSCEETEAVLVERRITPNEIKRIDALLRGYKMRPGDESFETVLKVPLHIKDILSLSPRSWLSGDILSVYGVIIKEMTRERSENNVPTIHIEDCYFMNYLLGYHNEYFSGAVDHSHYGTQLRKRLNPETLGYNPAEMLIIFPINEDRHWTLAVIDPLNSTIYMLDSIYSGKALEKLYSKQIMAIQTMLPVALFDKTDTQAERKWKAFCVDDVPKQKNTFDCGVFIIAYMDLIARGKAVHFKPNLDVTKRVICRDILTKARVM